MVTVYTYSCEVLGILIELPAAVRVFIAGTKYGQTLLLRHESESLCVFITDECNIVVNPWPTNVAYM
jgi:hypothetical protein